MAHQLKENLKKVKEIIDLQIFALENDAEYWVKEDISEIEVANLILVNVIQELKKNLPPNESEKAV